MATVTFNNMNKVYGGQIHAVRDFNLEIQDHEFIVLVGPSGCGKSTTLRMLAGLEDISSGTIKIGDRIVNELPPRDRDIAMVFQNYALYQHMTVYDNLAFGLRNRKVPVKKIQEEIDRAVGILGIGDLLDRKPRELSGGQQQRVALGRCIMRNPEVFLFDEPLSNLDAKLRAQMRVEIKKLRERVPTTSIYVTHDQVEAMTLGDRVVIMKDGVIEQVGTPLEVYNTPASKFVGSFIGAPHMNFVDVRINEKNGELHLEGNSLNFPVPVHKKKALAKYVGKQVILGIRPEHIALSGNNATPYCVNANIWVVEQMGAEIVLDIEIGGQEFTVSRIEPNFEAKPHEEIPLSFRPEGMHFFDADTESVIA